MCSMIARVGAWLGAGIAWGILSSVSCCHVVGVPFLWPLCFVVVWGLFVACRVVLPMVGVLRVLCSWPRLSGNVS